MPPVDRPPSGPDQPTAWLVIPYFSGDVGRPGTERPLTDAKAISWLCPSIVVDGQPGVFAFERGQQISLTVAVANFGYGGIGALTRVTVWWVDPTVGFTAAHPFGEVAMLVPADGVPVTSPEIRYTIPATAPRHVCLLARATTALDGTSATKTLADGTKVAAPPDPVNDRHWAQANLTEAVAAADGSFEVTLEVANPFAEPMLARFDTGPLSHVESGLLGRMLGQDVAAAAPDRIQLASADDDEVLRHGAQLAAGERLPLTLHGHMPAVGENGSYLKIVAALARQGEDEGLTGSLGVRVSGG
jgi:hypothetical protein